jgi:hypothetical protein
VLYKRMPQMMDINMHSANVIRWKIINYNFILKISWIFLGF